MKRFIAKSPQTVKAMNVMRVSANLPVNIMIIGEIGTGKETLVNAVLPTIAKANANDIKDLEADMKSLFVRDFDNVTDVIAFMKKHEDKRIVAASTEYRSIYDEFFPVIITIPPLSQRPEDLEALKRLYIQRVKEEFELESFDEDFEIDLSKNALSLKRSIYERALFEMIDEKRIMKLLEEYLVERVEMGYKDLLYLFEIPLLRAAKRKYKSALAMSKALQLNRATLTTKLKKYEAKV